MKRSLLIIGVLCLTVTQFSWADELADLRAENARLKAENAQLKARIGDLEVSNKEIKAQAVEAQQQKLSHYLQISDNGGSKTVTTYARRLPVTRGKIRNTSYQFAGSTNGGDITLTIFAGMSPGMFRTAKELELDVDGQAMVLPIADYSSDRRRSGAGSKTSITLYDETVVIKFTPAQIATLAKADQITGTLGMAQLGFGREDYNVLTVLAESLQVK